jgi:hypothetical protein
MFNTAHSIANLNVPDPTTDELITVTLPAYSGKQIARSAGRRDIANEYDTLAIIDVRGLFPDDVKWEVQDLAKDYKRYIAAHHDAVAFKPSDQGFESVAVYDEFRRMGAIWRYHRSKNWNGIGYHFLIGPSGRIYMAGSPDTHRAHTKGNDPEGRYYNNRSIGICFMGNFADKLGPDGRSIEGPADRPSPDAVRSFTSLVSLLTVGLKRDLDLHPHKFYQSDTLCPGDWTSPTSWGTQTVPAVAPFNDIPDLDDILDAMNATMRNTSLLQAHMFQGFESLNGDLAALRDWAHDLRNIRDDRTPD